MRRGVVIGAFLLCCGALLAGSIVTPAAKAEASLKFYQSAPAGWKAKPVGTLLKWHRERRSCPALAGLEGYRVMYVSRGALGGKVFETGMVYVPTAGRVPRGGRPVMAWDHGTAGVGDSAAPSRYPWLYPEPATAPWDWYAQWVGKLGRMGYVVTCPDYEGLGTPGLHTYLHAASQGRATIDAVRAAKQLAAKLDVATSRRWGVAGHSQGGQAALAAAELAGHRLRQGAVAAGDRRRRTGGGDRHHQRHERRRRHRLAVRRLHGLGHPCPVPGLRLHEVLRSLGARRGRAGVRTTTTTTGGACVSAPTGWARTPTAAPACLP